MFFFHYLNQKKLGFLKNLEVFRRSFGKELDFFL